MVLTFCFCRNRNKLHTNREVLCRISGLLIATLWMGGEDRWCIFHAMGGHYPLQTSHKESSASHRTKQLQALGTILVQERGLGWNWGKHFIFSEKTKQLIYYKVGFFYCLVNIALHHGFREGDLLVTWPLWFWVGQKMLDTLEQECIFVAKNFPKLIFCTVVYVSFHHRRQKATDLWFVQSSVSSLARAFIN